MTSVPKPIVAVARSTILAWGWRRAAIAFIAGAVSAGAMAPFNAWPVLFITFPLTIWLIDGAGAGRLGGVPAAALSGWWFGFGYFLAGLYWIGYAFLVDADIFAWMLPFAVMGLPAFLALFMALGFALARLLWTRDASRILAFAAALTFSEWLRGHAFTGFPWNAFGYALSEPLALAQPASLIGLWGMTFLALSIFASPASLADDRALTRKPWAPVIAAILCLVAMAAFGTARLTQMPTQFVANVKLRLMQPNLQQDMKFNYAAKKEVMDKYLALSDRATGPQTTGVRDTTILIWPESAFPFFLTREADVMSQIAAFLPKGTTLVTGAVRLPQDSPAARPMRAYNSIYLMDNEGVPRPVYDKLHLVPGGEYLPFQATMEKLGIVQLTKMAGGFIPGTQRRSVALPNAPAMLPLICYEVIFPGQIIPAGIRPGWIVNLTNDGWFGISSGPYQHLQQTRLRAIEEGLPIIRSANTGISAAIDALGRVTSRLDLGMEGVLDTALPTALPPTFYSRTKDGPAAVMVAIAVVIAIARRRQRRG